MSVKKALSSSSYPLISSGRLAWDKSDQRKGMIEKFFRSRRLAQAESPYQTNNIIVAGTSVRKLDSSKGVN